MARRVTGAALNRRIERQLREDLAAYGLDMARYSCTVESGGDYAARARFEDPAGHVIEVDGIYTGDAGGIMQTNRPELA